MRGAASSMSASCASHGGAFFLHRHRRARSIRNAWRGGGRGLAELSKLNNVDGMKNEIMSRMARAEWSMAAHKISPPAAGVRRR